MGRINIDINLAAQEESKYRNLYLVLGICGFLWVILTLFIPDLRISFFYFYWIIFLPGFINAILYGLGKKRLFVNNFPYLKINDIKIEKSKGGIFAKPEVSYWADIKSIDIKLFELQLTTKDDKIKNFDLSNLTDDNLKIVREFVSSIKKNNGL
ncbi:MAG: hypothetical protein MUE72_08120 [Chitinophagaceae bacterium]|jgi:hypothetical protein|nr:hypothetical protein [Chitinophagaceae bacterium]